MGIKEVFPEPALSPGVSAPGRKPGGIFPGERVAPLLTMVEFLNMERCLFLGGALKTPAFFEES